MRVPRSISVVRGTKIATFRKSSFSYAKIDFSGIFAHDQTAPAEGRRVFSPGRRPREFRSKDFPAGGRKFLWKLARRFPDGGRERGNLLSVVPPGASIGVVNKRDAAISISMCICVCVKSGLGCP